MNQLFLQFSDVGLVKAVGGFWSSENLFIMRVTQNCCILSSFLSTNYKEYDWDKTP